MNVEAVCPGNKNYEASATAVIPEIELVNELILTSGGELFTDLDPGYHPILLALEDEPGGGTRSPERDDAPTERSDSSLQRCGGARHLARHLAGEGPP